MELVDGVGVTQVKGFLGRSRALLVAAKAIFEHARVIDRQMRVTGVEFALHTEDAGLHEDGHLVGQQGLAAAAQIVVVPEGGDVSNRLFVIIGHVEHITVALLELVEFVDHKTQGVLGKDRGIAVLGGLVAANQRLVLDVDAHVVQYVRKGQGTTHHRRLVLRLAIRLRVEHGPLSIHEGPLIEHLLAECLHASGKRSEVFAVLHVAPFLWNTINFRS